MTADLVNLRRERKRRVRAAAGDAADANRLAHGLSAAQKRLAVATGDIARRRLDGHRMSETTPSADGAPHRSRD